MTAYRAPVEDMRFLLKEVFQVERLFASMPPTAHLGADLVDAVLGEMGKISEAVLAPVNRSGDQQGCRIEDGVVSTPAGFREAWTAFTAGGWNGLGGDSEYGGQDMPRVLAAMIEEMAFGANSSFALYAILTSGAAHILSVYGSPELKRTYLPKMYEGRWSGTMCLTEAHAGTDLGLIRCRAQPHADGAYRLTGTKIFITGGDHDLVENIIHLVLAKLPDAPDGPHGISLFLVPKMEVDAAGKLSGASNNVVCGSLEHKMGIRGSATCVLNFEGSKGFLVGRENEGLSTLFLMMNHARLSMGLQGNGLAESSWQIAVEYARQRRQGRAPSADQPDAHQPEPILVHPDVRRMLLTMRANIIAGRALSIYSASQLDTARFHPEEAARNRAGQLVALLTPVQKAWCSDRGFECCVMGQQVLGGHGYIAEWGLEQNVRDARIAQIYEGANGIQALDLMGRKTVRNKGALLKLLLADMEEFSVAQEGVGEMEAALNAFAECRRRLVDSTTSVIDAAEHDPNTVGAASYAYLELMGLTLYCFMWCRVMAAALAQKETDEFDGDYLEGLINTGEFFVSQLLPESLALAQKIAAGAAPLMAMSAEQF